jgi:hypothetical protein
MRRTIALALTLLFGLTLIAPIFATNADSNLPPCCRRNGRHHCRMSELAASRRGFTSVSERCPCCPSSDCVVQIPTCEPASAEPVHAGIAFRPALAPRAMAGSRRSFHRSHLKRGPPAPLA